MMSKDEIKGRRHFILSTCPLSLTDNAKLDLLLDILESMAE